jgi:rubredoxin
MVYLLVLAAGMLLASAQVNDIADDSPNQGFLSKYMSFQSDASKATLGDYKKFVTAGLNPTKHRGGPDLLSHHSGPTGHGPATDDSQHVFDLQKIADEEEEKAVQKLLANHSNMKLPMQLSAIGVAYLALLAMLRVRMRRGTTAAAGNILELKTQETSIRGQVGWSQQSSQNSRPLTLAMASEGNTPVVEAPEGTAAPAAEVGDQAPPDNAPEEPQKPELTERQKEIARLRAAETFMEKDTGKFQCRVCELEYDPEQGNPKTGIAPGTQFTDIQSNWRCPQCRASKDSFSPMTITIAGFAENQGYGFGGNSMTEGDKNLAIFGGIGFFFVLFLSGYLLT